VKFTMRKLAVLVTGLALAVSFPMAVQADKGGVPHNPSHPNQKPCPGKGKRKHKHGAPNNHGRKCGFAPAPTTTTTPTTSTPTTTTPTTPTP